MKTALVIFNGIRFPFYLADHVIEWTEKNTASLHALFIKAKHREKEGYVFPSDLDAAEHLTGTEDIEHGDVLVIRSQMKLLEDMAKTENIPFKSELLTDPLLKDILEIAKGSDILFIDADDNESGILSVTTFRMKDLVKKSPCPVETIKTNT
jgi:hypothetical protein